MNKNQKAYSHGLNNTRMKWKLRNSHDTENSILAWKIGKIYSQEPRVWNWYSHENKLGQYSHGKYTNDTRMNYKN